MIDKDNIEQLIEFGGLLVYEVSWFNRLMWKTEVECRTFNEDYAKKRLSQIEREGFSVKMDAYFVHFNQDKAIAKDR